MSVAHHPDEKIWFVTGVFGGLNPAGGTMQWYREKPKPAPAEQPGQLKSTEVDFEFVADLRMTPTVFKDIMLWMKTHVENYEKTFGEIKMLPKEGGEASRAPYA
jgi:hypothetical protein